MNLKKFILVISFISLLLFLSGCSVNDLSANDISKISDNVIKCNSPYIRYGADCCLDQNKNNICDRDEKSLSNNKTYLNNNSLNDNNSNLNNNKTYSNNDSLNNNNSSFSQDNKTQNSSVDNENVESLSNKLFVGVDEHTIQTTSADDIIAQKTNVSIDSDKDGIPDSLETSGELGYVTNPHKADTDGDGLSDLREYWWHCDPTNPDTNSDGINDGDSVDKKEAYPYKIKIGQRNTLGSYDQDGDGIPTAAEKFDLGLNFKSYSSNGDRYGDGQEYFDIDSTAKQDPNSIAGYVPADPYNPAVPDIAVRVKPEYKLIYDEKVTDGNKTSHTITARKSTSNTFTEDVAFLASVSVTTTAEINANPLKDESGVKVEAKAGIESRTAYTFQGQSYKSHEDLTEAYQTSETDLSNTKIRIWINVENVGNDILSSTLNEVTLNYYLGNDKEPFATQSLDTSLTNLKPGDIVSLTSTDIKLTYKEFKRVLEGQGITVAVEHFSFGEDQRYLENAKSSGLKLIVKDPDKYKQKYILLTNPISIKNLFDEMNYTYEFKNNNLVEFEGKSQSIDNLPYKIWQLFITKYHSDNKINIAKNIENTLLYPGDTIVVKYGIDSDGDRILNNDEIKLGTDPYKIDTDGDGLTDGYSYGNHTGELTLGTNPLLKDTDGDYVTDDQEVKLGTDPTDGNDYPNEAFLYDYTGYRGDVAQIIGEKNLNSSFNNKPSSIIVPKGLAAILYNKANFDKGVFGDNIVIFGSVSDLSKIGFNDKTTSIKVVKIEDLPYLRLINKAKGSESCLLLNIDKDKKYESRSYRCKYNDGKVLETYESRTSSSSSGLFGLKKNKKTTTQDPNHAQDSSYIKWKLDSLGSNLIHLENIGSSAKRDKYNICLFMDIVKDNNEEVSGYKCDDGEHENYLNWNIQPYSNGWFKLINKQATTVRKTNMCLWLDAYKDSSEEVQGYNCNTDKYKDNVLWRFVLY